MRPSPWHRPIPLAPQDQTMVSMVRRARLLVFLRTTRHELFDDALQEELTAIFKDRPKGRPPVKQYGWKRLICLPRIRE